MPTKQDLTAAVLLSAMALGALGCSQASGTPPTRAEWHWSALQRATLDGDPHRVKHLLEAGTPPHTEAQDQYPQPPLQLAARQGHAQIAQLLIEHGALEARGLGAAALSDAISRNHLPVVKVLIRAGVAVEAEPDPWPADSSPLALAAQEGHLRLVRYLLDRGAKVNRPGTSTPPLLAAVGRGHHEIAELLLERGADVNAVVASGELAGVRTTALSVASGQDSPEMARLLLAHGAKPNVTTTGVRTPLYEAKNAVIAAMLIKAGAKVDPVNDGAYPTPLHVAAYMGRAGVVRVLLEAGADPTATNRNAQTPLDIARARLEAEHGRYCRAMLQRTIALLEAAEAK
jgi:ankyrin repeat protein